MCLCFCTLVFASADIKTGEKLIEADQSKGFIGKTVVNESSSRGVCDESFSVTGYGDLNGNGSLELCYTDGTGFFNFAWDGGCTALTLTGSDGAELDVSASGSSQTLSSILVKSFLISRLITLLKFSFLNRDETNLLFEISL